MKVLSRTVLVALCLVLLQSAPSSAGEPERREQPDHRAAVVGGRLAPEGLWPELVALVHNGAPDFFQGQFCGGTLIDPWWVATAAHCVDFLSGPDALTLVVGRQDLLGTGGEVIAAREIHIHPAYVTNGDALIEPGEGRHDIALVRLAQPSAAPVVPPLTAAEEPDRQSDETVGYIAGWGSVTPSYDAPTFPTQVHDASILIFSDDTCGDLLRGYNRGGHLCAGLPDVSTCRGDSGGPLEVVKADGSLALAGITSHGPEPCGIAPGIYTRVASVADWIATTIAGNDVEPTAQPDPAPAPAPAPSPTPATVVPAPSVPVPPPIPIPTPTRSGYWMVGASGRVYAFGDARHYGEPATTAVDLEPTPSGLGYWVVDTAGRVFAYGDARHRGSVRPGSLAAGERVTSLSATPTGDGYWVFTTRGRVVPFGDAFFYGDMSRSRLNGPVLDSIATETGRGYYMVASDGGIFAFGDARFYGSMGGRRLNAPVQSLVPDPDGVGYWLVGSDGGVFAFQAPFRGSMGGRRLNAPVTGMVAFGNGYLMVATDGGVFNFSNQPFAGSLGGRPPRHPITAVAGLEG